MDISNNIIYDICGNKVIEFFTNEELKIKEKIENYYKHHNVKIELKNFINENLINNNIKI